MRRFFLILLFALFTIGITVYYFRVPLTLTIGKQILTEEQGLLECLDWSVDSWDRLAVERMCWRSEAVSVELSNATFDGDHFLVGNMRVIHQQTQTDDNTQVTYSPTPLQLDLPEGMPTVEVEKLTVSSPLLSESLNLSVKQTDDFAFTIDGDMQADLALSDTKLHAALRLSSPAVQRFLRDAKLPVSVSALTGKIEAEFNGQVINADLQLQSTLNYALPQCQPEIQVNGVATGQWDFTDERATLDLRQLPVDLAVAECQALLAELPQDWKNSIWSGRWQARISEPVIINAQTLTLPALSVQDVAHVSTVTLSEFVYQLPEQQMQGKLMVSHHSEAFQLLDAQVDFLLAGTQLESQGIVTFELAQAPEELPINWQALSMRSDFSLQGKVNEQLMLNITAKPQAQSVVTEVMMLDKLTTSVSAQALFAMSERHIKTQQTPFEQLQWQLDAEAERYQIDGVQGRNLSVSGHGDIDASLAANVNADIRVGSFKRENVRGKELHQQLGFSGTLRPEGLVGKLKGNSTIELVAHPQLVLRDVVLNSEGDIKGVEQLALTHKLTHDSLELQLTHRLEAGLMPFTLTLGEHGLGAIQSVASQFVPKLKIEEGLISASVSGELSRQVFDFEIGVGDASFLYDHHYVSGLELPLKGKWHAGELMIEPAPLSITEVRSGPVLTDVRGQITSDNNLLVLRQFSANIFSGQLAAEQVLLDKQDQEVLVTASDLDLMLISEAGREAGVELYGQVSGRLPVFIHNGQAEIRDGYLSNIVDSMLKVEDNASFNALKSQRPELQPVFDMLDELSIETLSADVNMSQDGQLELAVKIAGENKQKQQPVNFNYTHSENIYTLFRALRLSDEITQAVEKALNQ
ncbi:YdbH domain-containing protein [Pseudoalteromonas sp. McH1-42]|uniref:intermembrane phospholipid transport protein YdbH family protein n=1 Tax=Pseudoalteromonas sp. McH1-42 TaxID=2917752 RepID=UPI001EF6F1E8|nr:YdbH domain-containing protein [Pseudoalteromonas sp. McH1-42]MCG7561801.1 YdbH domain-containing protein [Pseudoalteromonas sp. McH1-42]